MFLLDQIEEKDKEYYDKIFNEYKTAFRKQHNYHYILSDFSGGSKPPPYEKPGAA